MRCGYKKTNKTTIRGKGNGGPGAHPAVNSKRLVLWEGSKYSRKGGGGGSKVLWLGKTET